MMIRLVEYFVLKNTGHKGPPNRRSARQTNQESSIKIRYITESRFRDYLIIYVRSSKK